MRSRLEGKARSVSFGRETKGRRGKKRDSIPGEDDSEEDADELDDVAVEAFKKGFEESVL